MRDVALTKQNVFFQSAWSIFIINFGLLKESDSFGWNGVVFYTADAGRYSQFLGNSKQKWSNLKDDLMSS